MKKLNMKKKLATAAMAFALCLAGSSITASAKTVTVNTTEFGKFTYGLTRSGSTVTATTKCTKAAPTLITKLEVQVNATGETLVNTTITKKNATSNPIIKAVNTGDVKLAAFSCHEARGKGSVAYHLAEKF